MPHLTTLTVGGAPAPWEALGLTARNGSLSFAGVTVVCAGGDPGIHSWHLCVEPGSTVRVGETLIDGIATTISAGDAPADGDTSIGSQRVVGVDHVVITTDDLDRTCAAIESGLGVEVRRERDAGDGVAQRFFKLDNTIVEVVTGPHVTSASASLWGFVVSVDDLFELAEELGVDVTSAPKRATQPGRYISTARSAVGLGVPFAMMTPHVPGMPTR